MSALLFQGNLFLATPAATPAYVDVSAEVTNAVLKVSRADVGFPATLAGAKSHGPGARTYSLDIGHFATDGTTGLIFPMLWSALATAAKELQFTLQFRDGGVSASNPLWSGTLTVPGAQLGGDVGALSAGTLSCTLTDAPARATA